MYLTPRFASNLPQADYSCACARGYFGINCAVNVNECASQPCKHGACRDGAAAYNCTCSSGHEGPNCERDTNECLSRPCQNGGTCLESNRAAYLSVGVFLCRCAAGYGGRKCEVNIDDCASAPCARTAVCVDAVSSYMCADNSSNSSSGMKLGANATADLLKLLAALG